MSIDDAWKTVDQRTREARWEVAQEEWEGLVKRVEGGEKTVFDAAMWLQGQGYRLKNLLTARATWWALLASQEKTGLFEPVVQGGLGS